MEDLHHLHQCLNDKKEDHSIDHLFLWWNKFLQEKCNYTSFPFDIPNDGINLKLFVETVENALISQALEKTGGNKNRASKLLQINRTTLIEKIKKNIIKSDKN